MNSIGPIRSSHLIHRVMRVTAFAVKLSVHNGAAVQFDQPLVLIEMQPAIGCLGALHAGKDPVQFHGVHLFGAASSVRGTSGLPPLRWAAARMSDNRASIIGACWP